MRLPDIVFNPSRAEREGDLASSKTRWKDFRSECKKGSVVWTGKKAAKAGDLYLFWFSTPLQFIGAVGVHSGEFVKTEWEGEARFVRAALLSKPVMLADIHADGQLAQWWQGNPFMGKPKTMRERPAAARRMLELIIERNPAATSLLSPYLVTVASSTATSSAGKAHTPLSIGKGKRLLGAVGRLPEEEQERVFREVLRAERDRALRPAVMSLWGRSCAACGLELSANDTYWECEVAHINEVGAKGTDGMDNALPLCRTHHWAFDKRLWAVHPKTLRIVVCSAHKKASHLSRLHGEPLTSATPSGPSGLNRRFLANRLKELGGSDR